MTLNLFFFKYWWVMHLHAIIIYNHKQHHRAPLKKIKVKKQDGSLPALASQVDLGTQCLVSWPHWCSVDTCRVVTTACWGSEAHFAFSLRAGRGQVQDQSSNLSTYKFHHWHVQCGTSIQHQPFEDLPYVQGFWSEVNEMSWSPGVHSTLAAIWYD